MTLKAFDLVGSFHDILRHKADPKDLSSFRAQTDDIYHADKASLIQYIKFGSAGERAGKRTKTTGKSNSFREKKQRKNRHFNECTKWVEENLHKVAKM